VRDTEPPSDEADTTFIRVVHYTGDETISNGVSPDRNHAPTPLLRLGF
jgi:hypothetical protein